MDAFNGRCRSLVTGGSGFIGQHLVAALLDRGDWVRVLDCNPRASHLPVDFIQGSILDRATLRRAMADIDYVYHLAAICHFWIPDRRDYDRINHTGTRMMLEASAEYRVRRFVYGSTEAIVLPQANGTEGEERSPDDIKRMSGPYTRSKFLAEEAVRLAAKDGLPATIVSPTAPIGPGDSNFTPPTAMLSLFLRHPPLLLLDCVLNFVDVRDVARGFVLAAERGRIGHRYVLAGENVRSRELFACVARMNAGRTFTVAMPGELALAAGKAAEWFSTNISHRQPVATVEAIRLALRSVPLDTHMQKSRAELGYSPRPIHGALLDALAWLSAGDKSHPASRRPAGSPQPASPKPAEISARRH